MITPFKTILKKLCKILIAVLLFMVSGYLICQDAENVLWFQSISSSEFSKSYNYYIFQDSEGFVWISSMTGLNRYDGARVRKYRSISGDSTSLFGENIHSSFFEDNRKNIWFSTFEAIHVYNRRSDDFDHFFIESENGKAIQENYRVFFLERDSFIWLRAGRHVYRYNFRTKEQSIVINDINSYNFKVDTSENGYVKYIYACGKLKDHGFNYYEFDNGQLKSKAPWFVSPPDSFQPTSIVNVEIENDTQLWVGTDKGLFQWTRPACHWQLISKKWDKHCNIAKWKNNKLVVLFKDIGLMIYDTQYDIFTEIERRFIKDKNIPLNDFLYLYVDDYDNLWVSHESNGLSYANFNKTKFYSVPKTPSLSGNENYSYWQFIEDENKKVWYGTNTSGVFSISPDGLVVNYDLRFLTSDSSILNNWVTSLAIDGEGIIWAGTRRGLFYYDEERDQFIAFSSSSKKLDVFNLYYKKDIGLFVLTKENGVFKVIRIRQKISLKKVFNSNTPVTSMFIDNNQNTYLCRNDSGLEVYNIINDKFHFIQPLPVMGNICNYELDASGKYLWMGSLFGLTVVDTDSLTISKFYDERNGLTDKNIFDFHFANNHSLWLSTAKGLVYFDVEKEESRFFSLADGTQSSEFYLYAGLQRKNGESWFGGSNGITVIPPYSIFDSIKTKSKLKITNIKINDENEVPLECSLTHATNVSEIKHLKLKPENNTISLEFVAIEYSDPSNNQLKYLLKGIDKEPVVLKKGESGFARYPNLPHGEYSFFLSGANSDGVWGDMEEVLKITVLPRFYERTWVQILIVLGLIGSVFLFFKRREKEIKEKESLKSRISENKMEALRSQMNPHFVFNSLQTVNGFITRQDLRGAIQYVNKFAKLMRMILENSRAGMISLEKEIELLELYMKIEAKRFSKPFKYKINVGDNLDTFETQVPSMMLQPFVENAIKHGLFHKKEGGQIIIGFHRENGHLKCYVEDNGVGREISARLNEQHGRSHVSRGLEIVKERLELIGKSHPGNYRVRIIDLHDLNQSPSGTRVEIRLPFK